MMKGNGFFFLKAMPVDVGRGQHISSFSHEIFHRKGLSLELLFNAENLWPFPFKKTSLK